MSLQKLGADADEVEVALGLADRWLVLRVARVGLCGRFDEGSLPELDTFAKGQLSIRAE